VRLVWITDPHLNFIRAEQAAALAAALRPRTRADAVLFTGDIGEAESFAGFIEHFADHAGLPIWFILGNHDAYGDSLAGARATAASMTGWLTGSPPIAIGDRVVLTGQDGWYDARLGDPIGSTVVLNDFFLVGEYHCLGRAEIVELCGRLGDRAASEARRQIDAALATGARRVVFATHVPPWADACWHEGRISDKNWLPWFTCQAMGAVLDAAAAARPDVDFLVLCGHTHGSGRARRAANLEVLTGGAVYGAPGVSGLIVDGEHQPADYWIARPVRS
jgi:hypothetical protein